MDDRYASPKNENNEEEQWLKKALPKTVSLPSLPKGPRPSMWQRAEGPDTGSSPCGDEDSWLKRTSGSRSLLRASPKWKSNADDEGDMFGFGCDEPAMMKCRSAVLDKQPGCAPKKTKKIDLVAKEFAHLDKHRQLKSILKDQRQMDRSLSHSRFLVEKPKNFKDPRCNKIRDAQNTEESVRRISSHISSIPKARHDILELQRKMASVCAPPPVSSVAADLKCAFADMLHRP